VQHPIKWAFETYAKLKVRKSRGMILHTPRFENFKNTFFAKNAQKGHLKVRKLF